MWYRIYFFMTAFFRRNVVNLTFSELFKFNALRQVDHLYSEMLQGGLAYIKLPRLGLKINDVVHIERLGFCRVVIVIDKEDFSRVLLEPLVLKNSFY